MTDKTNFEKLAEDLATLAKSMPADGGSTEDKVAAAAAEAGVDPAQYGEGGGASAAAAGAGDDEGAAGAAAGAGDVDDDEMLGKSFAATDAEGNPVRAYDATELIKSLMERVTGVESGVEGDREHLGKAMGLMTDMIKSQGDLIKSQGAEIEALRKSVAELGKTGSGRRAVLTVLEKPAAATPLAKANPDGLTRTEFLAKAETAMKAGKISGSDLAVAENYLNHGQAVPAGIVSRVMDNQ